MPKVFKLSLTTEQEKELIAARDHHEKPYVREKAAAILKVGGGQSIRQVALNGLLKRRSPHTVESWIKHYLRTGLKGSLVKTGRGRKAAFAPLSETEAQEAVDFVLHQSPRQYGLKRTGWRLQDVGRALHWLDGYSEAMPVSTKYSNDLALVAKKPCTSFIVLIQTTVTSGRPFWPPIKKP